MSSPTSRKIIAVLSALVAILALIITQLGGSAPQSPSPAAQAPRTLQGPGTVAGHPCDPTDYAMQCALLSQRPAISPNALAFSLHGVDFAWGGPRTCAQMRALGAHFVVGYLSYDPSKNLGLATVNEARRCAVATVVGWETTANRAAQGFAAGASDAREAGRQAAVLGNAHDAIWFAIDFDANGPEVYSYFKGAQSVLATRVNAYGGYRPLSYLHAHGAVADLNFQTYAWSHGVWLPASIAPLEQYLNGLTFDNDRAIAPNYGQFPSTPAGPSPSQITRWQGARNASLAAYHAHQCTRPVLGPADCRLLADRVVYFVDQLDAANAQPTPHCWGTRAQLNAAACQIVRPRVAIRSGARDATLQVLGAQNGPCASPAGFPAPVHSPLCDGLRQRARYFQALIDSDRKRFA